MLLHILWCKNRLCEEYRLPRVKKQVNIRENDYSRNCGILIFLLHQYFCLRFNLGEERCTKVLFERE